MVKTKLRGLALLRISWLLESSMSTKQRVNGPKRRGQTVKAQSAAGLAEVARHQPTLAQAPPQLGPDQIRGRASTTRARRGAAPHPPAHGPAPGLLRSRAADPKRLP